MWLAYRITSKKAHDPATGLDCRKAPRHRRTYLECGYRGHWGQILQWEGCLCHDSSVTMPGLPILSTTSKYGWIPVTNNKRPNGEGMADERCTAERPGRVRSSAWPPAVRRRQRRQTPLMLPGYVFILQTSSCVTWWNVMETTTICQARRYPVCRVSSQIFQAFEDTAFYIYRYEILHVTNMRPRLTIICFKPWNLPTAQVSCEAASKQMFKSKKIIFGLCSK